MWITQFCVSWQKGQSEKTEVVWEGLVGKWHWGWRFEGETSGGGEGSGAQGAWGTGRDYPSQREGFRKC